MSVERAGGESAGGGRRVRTGYLGLGSNVGDRLELLRSARARIAAIPGVRVVGASSVYETEAMDDAAGQRDFLNACVRVETGMDPEALLARCKAVERALGRRAGGPRHAPRPVDVDLLILGDLRRSDPELTLPHPEIARRRFVLLPLLELDPDLRLPGGPPLAQTLQAVAEQRVTRVAAL